MIRLCCGIKLPGDHFTMQSVSFIDFYPFCQNAWCWIWNNLFWFHFAVAAWNDCRTSYIIERILSKNRNKINLLKSICGLPFSNCFSSLKCRWLIENIPSIKEATQKGECYFGTLETYILWNLTGGLDDGVHLTDVTNASRTMLMNLETLDWDANLCHFFQIPKSILPKIRSCAEIFGYVYEGPLKGIPIAAVS